MRFSLFLSISLVAASCSPLVIGQQLEETPPNQESKPSWNLGEILQTFKVSSIQDSGPGTLREAISLANNSPGTDKIVFVSTDDLYSQPQTILLESPLPEITDNLLIDGFIEDMLWKASGVTIDCAENSGLYIAPSVAAKIQYLTVTNCTRNQGGAIKNRGLLVLANMMLMNNQAHSLGGAIFNHGHLQLINSTLYRNKAGDSGGSLYSAKGSLVITHTTISQNSSGNGIGVLTNNEARISNSILFGNQTNESKYGADCVSTYKLPPKAVQNIIGRSNNCGDVFSSSDPGLEKPAYYNGPTLSMPISTKGLAFNWADNTASLDELGEALTWDQRGNGDPRYAVGIADIGAFEIQPKVKLEVDTLSDKEIRGCTSASSDCSLRGAITLVNFSEQNSTITFNLDVFSLPTTLNLDTSIVVNKEIILDATGVAPLTIKTKHTYLKDSEKNIQTKNVNILFSR